MLIPGRFGAVARLRANSVTSRSFRCPGEQAVNAPPPGSEILELDESERICGRILSNPRRKGPDCQGLERSVKRLSGFRVGLRSKDRVLRN